MQPVLAGFEDYLPLLIFLVIWWVTSKKRKAARQQPPAPSSTAGSKGGKVPSIQEILRQVLVGEVEMPQPREPEHRLRQPAPPERVEPVELEFEEEWGEPVPVRQEPPVSPPKPEAPSRIKTGALETGFCQPLATKRLSRRALRKAVIWSEILRPPVGLRE